MTYTQTLTLDVANKGGTKFIRAKQSDSNHYVKITMMADGSQIRPGSGDTAYFRCLKPDGHSCYDVATINSDGTVTVRLTEQALAVAGQVFADVSILNEGNVLSTVSFTIMVDPRPLSSDVSPSHDEYEALTEAIAEAHEAYALAWDAIERTFVLDDEDADKHYTVRLFVRDGYFGIGLDEYTPET